MLKDADRNHGAVLGVDTVVSYESRHFADDGHVVLLNQLPHLLRVGDALVAPYRNIHSFCTTPFRKWRNSRQPLQLASPTTLASIGTRRIPQMSDLWTSENAYLLGTRVNKGRDGYSAPCSVSRSVPARRSPSSGRR